MIQLEPSEPTNYFALAKIYEDAGAYDEAETDAREGQGNAKPNDPAVYMTLAGYYNRQGQFDKTIDALEEARGEGAEQPGGALHHRHLLLGRGAPKNFRLKDRPRRRTTSKKGWRRSTRRLQIKPDYIEAIVYKGLLLRLQANFEKGSGQAAAAAEGGGGAQRQGRRNCASRRPPAPPERTM